MGLMLLALTLTLSAQNVEASYLDKTVITTAKTPIGGPGQFTTNVTVSNFVDIGCLSLTLQYNPSVIIITGITLNGAISTGMAFDWGYQVRVGYLAWNEEQVVSLPNKATLLSITFILNEGIEELQGNPFNWSTALGDCEYASFGGTVIYDAVFNN